MISSFVHGIIWGIAFLAVPALISNTILHWTLMKEDPLFYLRRCLAFSLFTINTWIIFLFAGSILSTTLQAFVFPDFSVTMGLFAVIPLRALAVFSMSRTSFAKRLAFTLIEPVLSVLIGISVLSMSAARLATGLLLSTLAGLTFAFALIAFVEHYGRRRIGFSPIRMFRAFLTDWLEADNEGLESYLDELGVETELDVAAFVFRRQQSHEIKGLVFVSNFHPGPFLNVGSSDLPYLLQAVAKKRLGAVALVPHGISGHELNLVSQEENAKIIRWLFRSLSAVQYSSMATPVVRSRNELATATSQILDGCALVTMTTAPSDMEDVPTEVANRVTGLTKGRFRHVALIDAHNCLTGPTTMSPEKIGALEDAVFATLQTPADSEAFKIGVARRKPVFQLRDGFGPGGISVMAIEASDQTFAYISIDGNNMIKDLREAVLDEVRTLGFSDGEVLTSDTHMVNGIVPARLGYYPVGAAVPREALLEEIRAACQAAMTDLEPCEVGALVRQIEVTTLGSKSLKGVMNVVYKISKLTMIALFPVIIAIAVISLLFLV
jgi:putative membrane protein